ncbi:hypothetical protein KC19_3G072300 [Ceratodon purpureus]|uniref:Uncharacterized protein n=1 Tax=Ceratodon purpureus TaxID=3225 RepID=A0A8T0IHV5_CERPU|nr:hypothetical protein KC19_3G072300 [Ceratodon purpureus]
MDQLNKLNDCWLRMLKNLVDIFIESGCSIDPAIAENFQVFGICRISISGRIQSFQDRPTVISSLRITHR